MFLDVLDEVGGAGNVPGVHKAITVVLESQQQVIQALQLLDVIISGKGKVEQHSDLQGR